MQAIYVHNEVCLLMKMCRRLHNILLDLIHTAYTHCWNNLLGMRGLDSEVYKTIGYYFQKQLIGKMCLKHAEHSIKPNVKQFILNVSIQVAKIVKCVQLVP